MMPRQRRADQRIPDGYPWSLQWIPRRITLAIMNITRWRSLLPPTLALCLVLNAGCASGNGDAAATDTPVDSTPTTASTATTSTATGEQVTLVIANPLMDMPEQLIDWAVEVRHATDGGVTFDVRSSFGAEKGYTDAEQAVLDAVQSGEADLGWVGARALPAFDPMLAPMLVDSHDLQERLFESRVPQQLLEEIDVAGVVGVGVLPGPIRRMLGVTRDFRAPEDFAGATIMSDRAGPALETMDALGVAELVPGAEGIEITTLDGLQAQVGAVVGNSYENVARSFTTNLNLWPRPLVLIANEDALAALSAERRDAVRGAADRVFPVVMDTTRQEDLLPETQRAAMCGASLELIELSQSELTALEQAVQGVHDRIAQDGGLAHLEEIRAIKDELGVPPDAFRCS
jgi:TRAP-type transport system periplasmic protein